MFVLIASGKTLTQIAEHLPFRLRPSALTVRIIEKTGLRSNAEMIRYGLERTLIE